MTTSQLLEKMVAYSKSSIHDIDHFIRVWAYAKTIGELEKLDLETQYVLEAAAITHDIACPFCREKYGRADWKDQEAEGPALAEAFFDGSGMSREQIERVKYLIGHHHTFTDIDGMDYQILIEADYIVNAQEKGFGPQTIRDFTEKTMKTEAGKRICRLVFGI